MAEKEIESLLDALALSPDNLPLRLIAVKSLFDSGDHDKACLYAEELDAAKVEDPDAMLLMSKVFCKASRPEEALSFLKGEQAEIEMERARCYLELDEKEKAEECYKKAVSENAALEDTGFEALLKSTSIPQKGEGPKLRVIANDATDIIEIKRVLAPPEETIVFDDVGGLDDIKKQIRRKIITPFQKPSLFQRFRRKIGGGILLYGPPGCGKTLLARATAGECRASFFNVTISDILDMYIGESESRLHAVFEQARQNIPAVVFFDEVEALASKRRHTREATSSKLVSQFLSELDGFAQNNSGVLILAATNVPWALDPAFRRPGRFDRIIFVAPPDKTARQAILEKMLSNLPGADTISPALIAAKTSSFSGADLKNLLESAVDEAIDESLETGREIPLRSDHFKSALNQIKPTTLEWLTTARNYAKYSNESGQYTDVLNFLKKYGK